MSISSNGLHHVTAIAGRPQANIEFYVRLLGLRLVKRTVNYEDPQTYHFYFGDVLGNPGSLITFFPWAGAGPAVRGRSEALAVAFRVPPGALGFWRELLDEARLQHSSTVRGDREVLHFNDPDGTPLELVEGNEPPAPATAQAAEAAERPDAVALNILAPTRYWTGSSVPPESAIVGLDTVTLNSSAPNETAELLNSLLGWRLAPGGEDGELTSGATEGARLRLIPPKTAPEHATALELVSEGGAAESGRLGTGSIHHVALRVADRDALAAARELLLEAGLSPTKVRNRTYFSSVYFRDPSGAVLELATDEPGFVVDEPADELGLAFKLPEWLEPDRQSLRAQLPVTASPEYADRFR